jgi:vacuolar-type H+-ATPase subunit H
MNEKRIQQVLEIEKQAQQILDSAIKDAEQLPVIAEKEAQELIEKARSEAKVEASQIVAKARSEAETSRIISEAEEKTHKIENLAMKNFDRAVAFVLERVIGKE